MASRKLLFMQTGGYAQEVDPTANDDFTIGKITFTGVGGIAIDAGSQKISNVLDPVSAQDAATKNYVDTNVSGLQVHAPVRAATVGSNITVASAAPNTLDGVSLATNDRILVKDQTTASQNGIYIVQTLGTGANGVWVRATDADTSAEMGAGTYVYVNEGTVNADSAWVLTTNNPITLGTTSLTFTQFSGLGQITAGNGLTKTGNTLDIGSGNGITVNADNIVLNLSATPGLQFNGSAVEVKANTAAGIGLSASGVGVVLNGTNPGLAFTSTYVDVKYDGARAITAGASGIGVNIEASNPSLQISSNELGIKFDGSGGLQKLSTGTGIKLNGTTLALAAGGISVLGVPAAGTWQIGGSATSANVTAANLGTLTAGSSSDASALHTHLGLAAASTTFSATAGAGGLTKGQAVYISANNTVLPGDTTTNALIAGIANATVSAAASVGVQQDGVMTGILSAATAGVAYYMGSSGSPVVYASLPAASRVIRLGYALNATDMVIDLQDFGKKIS